MPLDFRTTVTLLVCSQASSVYPAVESSFEDKSASVECNVWGTHSGVREDQSLLGRYAPSIRTISSNLRRAIDISSIYSGPRPRRCYLHSERRKHLEKLHGATSHKIQIMKMERRWDDLTGENRSTRRRACSSATFSTANPTRTSSNICHLDDRPATNCLSLIITRKAILI